MKTWHRTSNDQLLSSFPGRTFRSWERRADYNPDEGALLPYATLVEIIRRHLIDVHSQQRHPDSKLQADGGGLRIEFG